MSKDQLILMLMEGLIVWMYRKYVVRLFSTVNITLFDHVYLCASPLNHEKRYNRYTLYQLHILVKKMRTLHDQIQYKNKEMGYDCLYANYPPAKKKENVNYRSPYSLQWWARSSIWLSLFWILKKTNCNRQLSTCFVSILSVLVKEYSCN